MKGLGRGCSTFLPRLAKSRQFGGGGAVRDRPPKKVPATPKKSSTSSESPLIRVIQYAGDADDWQQEQGEGPRITEIGGLLVVNQNWIVHEQIKRILADLRRMKKDGAYANFDKGPCDESANSDKGCTRPRASESADRKVPLFKLNR